MPPPSPPEPPDGRTSHESIDLDDFLLESEDLKGLASSPDRLPGLGRTRRRTPGPPNRGFALYGDDDDEGGDPLSDLDAEYRANGHYGDEDLAVFGSPFRDAPNGGLPRPASPFPTIDWLRDAKLDRARKRRNLLAKLSDTSRPTLRQRVAVALESARGWFVVLFAGFFTGLVAACIAVATAFLVDLKSGLCTAPVSAEGNIGWYLGKRVCCLGTAQPDEGECPEWRDWSDLLVNRPGGIVVNYAVFVILSVFMGLASCYLVVHLAPWASGEGISELKTLLGGNKIPGFLSARTLLVKAAGLPLAIGSGLSIGKEGALLHVAACIGRYVGDVAGVFGEGGKREMLSSAAAAGIAVAFGAPIGGVLYSLEEVSTFFPLKTIWRSFFCAMVAAATVQMVDPYRGKRVVFEVPPGPGGWHMFEVFGFAFLGVGGAIFGSFFIAVNLKIQTWRDRYSKPPDPSTAAPVAIPLPTTDNAPGSYGTVPVPTVVKDDRPLLARPMWSAFALSLVTALFFFPSPLTRLDDLRVLELLFRDCPMPLPINDPLCPSGPVARTKLGVQLLAAMTLKALLTTATYSLPVPSSVFIPSMVVGATFGRCFGMIVETFAPQWMKACIERPDQQCIGVGRYAMLGAIGALGGVTRLTASLTVIMFEVTGQLDLVVPSMVTLATARLVSNLFLDRGFADAVIRLKGYPYLPAEREGGIGADVAQCMTPAARLLCLDEAGTTWKDVRSLMRTGYFGFPVIREGGLLTGYVAGADIERAVLIISGVDDGTLIDFEERFEGQRMEIGGGHSVIVVPDTATAATTPALGLRSTPVPPSPSRLSIVNLRPILDTAPLTLNPYVPADTAADLFRKIGPRCILVTRRGRLAGLLTKKDLLGAIEEREEMGDLRDAGDEEFTDGSDLDDDDLFLTATVDAEVSLLERARSKVRSWVHGVTDFVNAEMEDEVPLVTPIRNRRRGD